MSGFHPKLEVNDRLPPGTLMLVSPGAVWIKDMRFTEDGKIEVTYGYDRKKFVVVKNIGQ